MSSAITSSETNAIAKAVHANSLTFAWGAAVRSLMTTADASLRKSNELHHRFSLRKFQQFLLPCRFPGYSIVKPRGLSKTRALAHVETALKAEVRDALRIRQHEGDSAVFFELTYLDPALLLDFLAVLDLLDLVRQGFFDMILIVPSASTWSRARHSRLAGQHPLRSRSSPLGLSSLSLDDSEKVHHANRELVRRAGAPLSFNNGWAHSHIP